MHFEDLILLIIVGAFLFFALFAILTKRYRLLMNLFVGILVVIEIIISIPSMFPQNVIINVFAAIMTILGYVFLHRKKRAGLTLIVSSCLLVLSCSFLYANGFLLSNDNILISSISLLIPCIIIVLILMTKEGETIWMSQLSSLDNWKSRFLLGCYSTFSIAFFIFAMIVFPTYRTIKDGSNYRDTYLVESEGEGYGLKWYFEK